MLHEAIARGWDDLIGRWGGPMSFRLLMQPAVAILFAIRAGIKDARQNEPPFLWALFSHPHLRRSRLRHVWTDVGKVFIVALVLDAIYQLIVHSGIYMLEMLVTAIVLVPLPYIVSRGLVTRIARWMGIGLVSDNSLANEKEAKP